MLNVDTAQQLVRELGICLRDLQQVAQLGPGQLLVVGASTSELAGQRIGTASSADLGKVVVDTLLAFAQEVGCELAFQCCEHLNRALVVPRALALQRGWREVYAVPVPGAGGAVAANAYFALQDPCLVERVQGDAGIDIGDTLVGMHLRPVAVPVRGSRKEVGAAHVVMARSRPPRIGGERAVYDRAEAKRRLDSGSGATEDC